MTGLIDNWALTNRPKQHTSFSILAKWYSLSYLWIWSIVIIILHTISKPVISGSTKAETTSEFKFQVICCKTCYKRKVKG